MSNRFWKSCCLCALFALIGCGSSDRDDAANDSTTQPSTHDAAPVADRQRTATTDWPRLYGPYGDCVSTEDNLSSDWSNPDGPPVVWTADVGTGYSAPVIAEGRLVLLHRVGDEDRVTCMDAIDGSFEWERSDPTSFDCNYPAYSDGPYSTPVISNGVVYAQTAEGELRALSMSDGRDIWQRDLSDEYCVPKLGYSVGHSPLLDDGQLILNLGGTVDDCAVVALDASTGDTLWTACRLKSDRPTGSFSTPVAATIHGHRLIFVVTSEAVVCLRADDGQQLWSIPFGTGSADTPNSTTPLVVNDLVLISGFRADVFCLKILPDGGYTQVWRNRRSIESCYNPLTYIDGYVYGWHSFDRTMRCIQLATGDVQWKERSIFERGNHIAVDGRLFVLGEQGHLGCVSVLPDRYHEEWVTPRPVVKGPCYTMPALSAGRLYLRNEGTLLCMDLRPRPRVD